MTTLEMAAALIHLIGMERISVGELDRRLHAIGYRRDKSLRCDGISRFMTGELAGESYQSRTYGVCHIATRLSAFNVDAPKGPDFQALQTLRMDVFAVVGDRIVQL